MNPKINQNRIVYCVLTLLLTLFAWTAQAQSTLVSDVIKDAQGPVPGASVLVKGTLNGTVSGTDGTYSLAVSENDVLQFSCIGYKSQEIKWGAECHQCDPGN